MPAGVAKLNGKTEIPWELAEEFAQGLFAFLWCEGRRKLNQNDLKFRRERFDGAKKGIQFGTAIAQPAGVGNLAWQFARESKCGWRHLDPATHGVFGRRPVERGIDLHSRKIAGVKLKPA